MKQRKEFQKPAPSQAPEPSTKKGSSKSVQELTEQVSHIIGKHPDKAAKVIEGWVKEPAKSNKKAA